MMFLCHLVISPEHDLVNTMCGGKRNKDLGYLFSMKVCLDGLCFEKSTFCSLKCSDINQINHI